MTCRKAGDLLSPYLDGELGPRPSAALEAHLAGCAACRAELAGLRRAVNALRTPPPWVQPEGLLADFKERLQRERARPLLPARAPLLPRFLVPAAALAAVLLAGVAVTRPGAVDRWHQRAPAASAPRMAMAPPPPPINAPAPAAAGRDARPEEARAAPAAIAKSPVEPPASKNPRASSATAATSAPRKAAVASRPVAPASTAGSQQAARAPRRERPRAAPTLERPRILLPPGVAEREEAARASRKRREAPTGAQRAQPPPAPPAAAGGIPPAAPGPASLHPPAEAPAVPSRGWVAIRILPRADASESEVVAGAAADAPAALQRAAAEQAPPAAGGSGKRLAKSSGRDRPNVSLAPSLVAAMHREVNLTVSDVPLADMVGQLGRGAGVAIALDPSTPDRMRVHAELRGMPLREALARVAEAAGLVIAPQGEGVLLKPGSALGRLDAGSSVWSAEWGSAPRLGFPLPSGVDRAR